jgi:uncharacterized protein with HEPN domain
MPAPDPRVYLPRNVLIHNYEGADADMVWGIVEREVPQLLAAVLALLGETTE